VTRRRDYFLAILRDQTPKVLLESALRESLLSEKKTRIQLAEAQKQLVESGKLATLGELSAGLAHELNQPLQIIRGFSQELQEENGLNERSREYVSEIQRASVRMSEIVRHFRMFLHRETIEKEDVELRSVLNSVVRSFTHDLSSLGIKIQSVLPTIDCWVSGNKVQIEQVLTNLISNSRDAIQSIRHSGGLISITLNERRGYHEIEITDNGCGMSSETQKKIFNPFFTTKSPGKGMGLGMAITFNFIEQLGGKIEFKSELNQGSQFKINMPVKQITCGSMDTRGGDDEIQYTGS
jgi:two-component system C4-dicarboxylate transport sensor histidine kinase DctB